MKDKRKLERHERMYGPHFNESCAIKVVSKMQNEDGSYGEHWSLQETTTIANQYGISLTGKFNKYDWYVAMNMIYSDYYKVIRAITNNDNIKIYIEFAKAWLNDKDVDEGKMWYYYKYVICDVYHEDYDDDDDYEYDDYRKQARGHHKSYDEYDNYDRDYEYRRPLHERIGSKY